MVTLINKKITLAVPETETQDYAYLIKQVLNVPPKEGFSFEDFIICKRIDDAVKASLNTDKVGEELELKFEDADFAELKKRVSNMRWNTRHEDIFSFMNDIINHK